MIHTYADVAESAYKAYGAVTGNKNFRGEPMPEFKDLPETIRTAWEAAALQVMTCKDRVPSEWPDPLRWAGWKLGDRVLM